MKVFVTQLFHEASSFVPIKITIDDFKRRHYLKGFENVRARFVNDRDWVSGALEPFIQNGDEIDCGICTACLPGGMIELESFKEIERNILEEFDLYLHDKGQPDVVMMLLHGANLVDGLHDPDGYLVESFRKRLSDRSLIGVTLDFHANISQKLVDLTDIMVVGKEYPHVDTYDRGKLCSNLTRKLFFDRSLSWKTYRFPIPIITGLPNQATVGDLPFNIIMKRLEVIQKELDIVDISVSGGFAFGDCHDVGMNLIAVNEKIEPCKKALAAISNLVWDLREEMMRPIPKLAEVWNKIESKGKNGRVVVADVSDSPGSGGAANETHLLKYLISTPTEFVSAFHVDPNVVKHAEEIGVGKEAVFLFGSDSSHSSSQTLEIKAKVEKILNYEYTNIGDMMKGAKLNGGSTTVLRLKNGLIVVTSERIQAYDINAFLNIGINIEEKKPLIIAIKSTAHFRATYTALADEGIILVDCDGWSNPNFHSFDYKYRRKPLLPLEKFTKSEWDTSTSVGS